jgi:hypothetical protein
LERELFAAVRPALTLRKCEPLSEDDQSKLRAKREFEAEFKAAGYKHVSDVARRLGVKESTVRGWINPKDFTRNPPSYATEILGKEAQIRHAHYAVEALKASGER